MNHTWVGVGVGVGVSCNRFDACAGKTYTAIQRLKESPSGVYCGPLRLLALEVHDTLNAEGVFTNLITGQEKKLVPFANHVSCTVEMVDVTAPVDVCVIDEI
ncbi:hypothetical protein, partial [Cylindrospermopsis raciborskii]|uniref:hypothetical protein n=1 Tax=Cylindrospermopsis raciborskii TaxID=77022 RepID=UPI0026E9C419